MPSGADQENPADPVPPGDPEGELRRLAGAIICTARQPLLILDGALRVEMANHAFLRAFGVDEAETRGRLLYDLGNGQWNIPRLRDLLEKVLPENGTVEEFRVEHEFEHIGRRAMLLNARRLERPGRPDTILLAIDDVTEQERLRWQLDGEREYARKLVQASRDALLVLGWDLRVRAANQAFCTIFRTTPAETEGQPLYALGNGQWDIPQLRTLLERVLPDNDGFDDFEVEHDFPGLGRRIMVLNARRVDHLQLILLAIEDRTAMREAERALRRNEALLSSLLRHAPVGIGLVDRDGRWVLCNALMEALSPGLVAAPDRPAAEGAGPPDWPGARALRGEGPASQVVRTEADGRERWLRVSAAPVEDGPVEEGGAIGHVVVIVEDITDDKRSEQERELLLGELNHRVKNLFGVIRSLVAQGAGGAEVEAFRTALKGRLDALGNAHALALEARWGAIDLAGVAARTLGPYAPAVEMEGPPVSLPARQALSLSLVLHELATNAMKYGALSVPEGRARLAWRIDGEGGGRRVALAWQERGGPPVAEPVRRSFGTTLLERVFAYDLQGGSELAFPPQGVRLEAWFPLP